MSECKEGLSDGSRFVQTVLYKGKLEESLVETRIRLYKGLKTKRSEALPPAPDSLTHAILRVHLQSYYLLQFQQIEMTDIDMEKSERYIDVEQRVVPEWFTGKM